MGVALPGHGIIDLFIAQNDFLTLHFFQLTDNIGVFN